MSIEPQEFAKSPEAFRTISEASEEIGVPPHVLRFWEGKFNHLRPLKRAGGRRFYRPQDMAILRGLKALLQDDGYTIRGVQKLIKDSGIQSIRDRANNSDDADVEIKVAHVLEDAHKVNAVHLDNDSIGALNKILDRLVKTRQILDQVISG